MPYSDKKREKLIGLDSAEFDEVFESEKEEIADEDDGVVEKYCPKRCVSGTRKRRPPCNYSSSKTSVSVDEDLYLENNPDEFYQDRKIVHPRSRLTKEDKFSFQGFPAVRGEPIMLYSDVRVEIVEDLDRPCSVQSDDSFEEEDQFPFHRPRTHQASFTEDLSNSFSSVISFAHQGSPRPGPSTRRPSINSSPFPVISSENNSRKRMLSAETVQSKRWKSEEPSNNISVPEITKPVIRKACGYLVPSEPSYDALLNFYKQTITAETSDYRCYYKHHPISLTPDDSTVQYK